MKKLTKRIYIGIFENCSLISRIGNPIVVPDNEKDSINVVNSISWLAGEIDKRYIHLEENILLMILNMFRWRNDNS